MEAKSIQIKCSKKVAYLLKTCLIRNGLQRQSLKKNRLILKKIVLENHRALSQELSIFYESIIRHIIGNVFFMRHRAARGFPK